MSKLLKVNPRPQENSELISQLGAFMSAYNADNAFGIANKRWIPCILEGAAVFADVEVALTYRNASGNNILISFGIPLPLIKNGKNLVITDTKIGIDDADANDYIDRYRLLGWSDYGTIAALIDDNTDLDFAQEYIYGHANKTVGGIYERIILFFESVSTSGAALDISFVQVEYYYA